jgi:hypothetical protein
MVRKAAENFADKKALTETVEDRLVLQQWLAVKGILTERGPLIPRLVNMLFAGKMQATDKESIEVSSRMYVNGNHKAKQAYIYSTMPVEINCMQAEQACFNKFAFPQVYLCRTSGFQNATLGDRQICRR